MQKIPLWLLTFLALNSCSAFSNDNWNISDNCECIYGVQMNWKGYSLRTFFFLHITCLLCTNKYSDTLCGTRPHPSSVQSDPCLTALCIINQLFHCRCSRHRFVCRHWWILPAQICLPLMTGPDFPVMLLPVFDIVFVDQMNPDERRTLCDWKAHLSDTAVELDLGTAGEIHQERSGTASRRMNYVPNVQERTH